MKVDIEGLCSLCGYHFGGHDAEMAATRICSMIDGGDTDEKND